jgi:hypothetical protein
MAERAACCTICGDPHVCATLRWAWAPGAAPVALPELDLCAAHSGAVVAAIVAQFARPRAARAPQAIRRLWAEVGDGPLP